MYFSFIRPILEYADVVWDRDETSYSLRNADNLRQIHASSRSYYDSFLPSTIREWNELPDDIKSISSRLSFNHKLEKDTSKPQNISFVVIE